VKLALPKGKLQKETAALLDRAGFGLDDYNERSRSYRLKSSRFPDMFVKVFRERDIPIQVAIGNYDLGICGLDWMGELMAKYPSSDVIKLRDLGYGGFDLCAVAGRRSGVTSARDLNRCFEKVRIVSEYQNIAEAFALKYRLRRFGILPILGGRGLSAGERRRCDNSKDDGEKAGLFRPRAYSGYHHLRRLPHSQQEDAEPRRPERGAYHLAVVYSGRTGR
jgi:ATP phosphoribosyltransferase